VSYTKTLCTYGEEVTTNAMGRATHRKSKRHREKEAALPSAAVAETVAVSKDGTTLIAPGMLFGRDGKRYLVIRLNQKTGRLQLYEPIYGFAFVTKLSSWEEKPATLLRAWPSAADGIDALDLESGDAERLTQRAASRASFERFRSERLARVEVDAGGEAVVDSSVNEGGTT
jgi:hypothetical protein